MSKTDNLIPLCISDGGSGIETYTSSSVSSSFYPYKATDRDISTYWASRADEWNSWYSLVFPYWVAVTQYTITVRSGTPPIGSAPYNWTFNGLKSDGTWEVLDTQSAITFNSEEKKTFSFSNTTEYKEYRWIITENYSQSAGSTTSIVELEMMADVAPNPTRYIGGDIIEVEVDHKNEDILVSGDILEVELDHKNNDILVAGDILEVEIALPLQTSRLKYYNPSIPEWQAKSLKYYNETAGEWQTKPLKFYDSIAEEWKT